jgi:hypothetical protein
MTVMGEAPPEVWTDELRRTGQVVFPLRRRPAIWTFAPSGALTTVALTLWLPNALEASQAERVSAFAAMGLYLFALGFGAWQLVTQRPMLTVDHHGIRFRRKSMPWTEVGAIGIATGPVWGRKMPVIPKDVWAKDLVLGAVNVRDLPALRRWLETLLDEHRRSSTLTGNA